MVVGGLVVWVFGCLVDWLLVAWLFACLIVGLTGCWWIGCLVVWLTVDCLVVGFVWLVVGVRSEVSVRSERSSIKTRTQPDRGWEKLYCGRSFNSYTVTAASSE